MTSDNQLFFTSWKFLGDSKLGLYRVAWLTQERSVRGFLWERKVWVMFRSTDVHSRRLPQGSERRKSSGSAATTRFPRASCFWETNAFCTRNMGAHVQCTSAKKVVSSDFAKILEVATKIRETCEKTLFTPSSPLKTTKLYRFCLSDKRSQNCQSILSNKVLLKSLSLFSDKWSPKGIACLAIVVKLANT